MNRRVVVRLHDALESAQNIVRFIAGETVQSYVHNRLVCSAVQHELMIIGEALNVALRDEPGLLDAEPALRGWVGLRNLLIHAYTDINPEIVWKTATTEIPELIEKLETLLASRLTDEDGDTPLLAEGEVRLLWTVVHDGGPAGTRPHRPHLAGWEGRLRQLAVAPPALPRHKDCRATPARSSGIIAQG